jgi:hypothetical protein
MSTNHQDSRLESLQIVLDELYTQLVLHQRASEKQPARLAYEVSLTKDLHDTLIALTGINDANQLKFFYQLAQKNLHDIKCQISKYAGDTHQLEHINMLVENAARELKYLSCQPKERAHHHDLR